MDEDIDLDEILREMGYGEEDEEDMDESNESNESNQVEELTKELEEAYATVKELKSTINEVNLLNAKLLYANKLFRSYAMKASSVNTRLDKCGWGFSDSTKRFTRPRTQGRLRCMCRQRWSHLPHLQSNRIA